MKLNHYSIQQAKSSQKPVPSKPVLSSTDDLNAGKQVASPTIQSMPAQQMPMAQQDPRQALLEQLHDVKTPAPIGTWPPAIGWWIIALVVIGLTTSVIYFLRKKYNEGKYRKEALKQYSLLEKRSDQLNSSEYAQAIMRLLKRTCLARYSHSRNLIAALHGPEWIHLLTKTTSSPINVAIAIDWVNASYNPKLEYNRKQLNQFAKQWIKSHKHLDRAALQNILNEFNASSDANNSNEQGAANVSV